MEKKQTNKKMRLLCWLGVMLLVCQAGCGASGSSDSAASKAAEDSAAAGDSYDYEDDYAMEEASMDDSSAGDEVTLDGSAAASTKSTAQKLIYTYQYNVETTDFDSFIESVAKKVDSLGGYTESSEVSGESGEGGSRYASMTLRIPANNMGQMIALVKDRANVLSSNQSSENVTLRYVDMQSHVKALRTEQEALLSLLEKATKVDDIISLQSQLTEVRYEIESYESQLRTYDNLVDYSTLNLSVSEVRRETATVDKNTTFGEEVKTRFGDNLYAVLMGLRGFVIWLLGSIPFLILLALIVGVVVAIVRAVHRHNEKKRASRPQPVNQYEMYHPQAVQNGRRMSDKPQEPQNPISFTGTAQNEAGKENVNSYPAEASGESTTRPQGTDRAVGAQKENISQTDKK